jgi:L-fuconolactonase
MAEWIDAHHHLWRYNRAEFDWIDDSMQALQRDYLVSDLVHETTRAGVDGTVVVQARQTLEETYWLLDCADQTQEILGVVGWVPLDGDDLPKVLRQLLTRPLFKGVRHVVQGEPDNFLLGDAFNRGISALLDAGLAYDLLIQEHQLREAKAFVGRHPQQRFVIDHVAKPKITARQMEPWRSNLLRLADCTNVSCKVSGMVTEADWAMWTAADVEPFLEVALDAFGPGRLIAGSDWPVCLVASSYKRWWSTLFEWAQKLSPFDREALFGGNARKFYVLDAAHGAATSTVTTGFPNH